MDWVILGQITLVIALIAAQLPAVRKQWLEDRAGVIKTVRLLAYYFVFLGVGLLIFFGGIQHAGTSGANALAGMGFLLGWILLGASWLIKLVPRYREVPAWLLKPMGVLDVLALVVISGSLVVLFV